MQASAKLKYARISPRKVSIVADLIRGKDVKYARGVLTHTPKAAAALLLKTLNSACANAENNLELDADNLFVKEILIGAGTMMKRVMPRAQGRAFRILKRTSHITVSVAERD
ncbi:50S ribosomal protein L22 [Clostridia bacterium]|nr:50S ribosomal protein L22 [Clostridia bacterium]